MRVRARSIGTTNAQYRIFNTQPKIITLELVYSLGLSEGGTKEKDNKDYLSITMDLQWNIEGNLIIETIRCLLRTGLIPSAARFLDEAVVTVVYVIDGVKRVANYR